MMKNKKLIPDIADIEKLYANKISITAQLLAWLFDAGNRPLSSPQLAMRCYTMNLMPDYNTQRITARLRALAGKKKVKNVGQKMWRIV